MGDRKSKLQKLQISQNEFLRMTILTVFSPEKFEIYFLGPL